MFGAQFAGTGIQSASAKKKRLREDTAADLEIAPIARIAPPITRNLGAHLLSGTRAVRLAERFPGQRTRQCVGVGEDAAPADHIARRVQLEQEQLARLERPEIGGRRRPEIDLGKVRPLPQHVEPVAIRDGDDEVDAHCQPPSSCARFGSVGQSC